MTDLMIVDVAKCAPDIGAEIQTPNRTDFTDCLNKWMNLIDPTLDDSEDESDMPQDHDQHSTQNPLPYLDQNPVSSGGNSSSSSRTDDTGNGNASTFSEERNVLSFPELKKWARKMRGNGNEISRDQDVGSLFNDNIFNSW